MERWISRRVVEEYEKTLRLHELLREYANGSPVCPICRSEIVACEGEDEPYFWRCVRDYCYTREIDQPGPQGGVIICARCGSPVEYGEWGGKPAWRCTKDRHHHQRLAESHLDLPRMCALIPRGELRKCASMSACIRNGSRATRDRGQTRRSKTGTVTVGNVGWKQGGGGHEVEVGEGERRRMVRGGGNGGRKGGGGGGGGAERRGRDEGGTGSGGGTGRRRGGEG